MTTPPDPQTSPARVASLFPTEITRRSSRRRRRVRRAVAAGVAVVVLAGGGLAVAEATGSTPTRYRTATAGQHEVTSTIDGVATIQPVAQADVAFSDDGTVASVGVAVGDAVTAGQTLAQQQTDDLMVTVRSKEADLDKARLILAEAVAGNDVTSLVGGAAGRSYVLSAAVVGQMLAALPAVDTSGLSGARQAVASAQHAVDSAMSEASAALSSATSVCSAIGVDPTGTDPGAVNSAVDACQRALNAVVADQNAVKAAQDDLAGASSALDSLLEQLADDVTDTTQPATTTPVTTTPVTTAPAATTTQPDDPTTNTPPAATTTPDRSVPGGSEPGDGGPVPSSTVSGAGATRAGGFGGSGGSGGGGASGAGGVAAKTPSASDVASYQQAVDAAESALAVADLAVAQATIVSPIDGTVIAVNITPGESVTGGATESTIVVQGAGGYEATTTVSLADVAEVEVGATATVLPDGASDTYNGRVVSVATVPSTSSSGTTTFGVAIALDGDTSALHNGGIGSVSIVTGTSGTTLAVPTSAVTTTGSTHTVEVADGTTTTTTRVEVGVVGPVWTEIKSGLTEGQQVVLAQLDKDLPTSATSSSNGTTAGGRTITINGRQITLPAGGGVRP